MAQKAFDASDEGYPLRVEQEFFGSTVPTVLSLITNISERRRFV